MGWQVGWHMGWLLTDLALLAGAVALGVLGAVWLLHKFEVVGAVCV